MKSGGFSGKDIKIALEKLTGSAKWDRTPSLEVKKNKKIRIAHAPIVDAKEKKSRLENVRSWLTVASDKELEKLGANIKHRRKKRTTTASRNETQTVTMVTGVTRSSPEVHDRELLSQTYKKKTTPRVKIRRKISAQDIGQLEAELFPEQLVGTSTPMLKLADR